MGVKIHKKGNSASVRVLFDRLAFLKRSLCTAYNFDIQLRISTSEGGLRKGSNKQEVAAIFPSKPKGKSVGGGELDGSNQTSVSWTSLFTFLLFLIVHRGVLRLSELKT